MAGAAAPLKFSRGVLRNSMEFPPVAKFDASRDNDAGHDHRGTLASKRILGIASGSDAKTLFRIFLRALTRCFYLAHFPRDWRLFRSKVDRFHSGISHQAFYRCTRCSAMSSASLATLVPALLVPPNKRVGGSSASIRPDESRKKISRGWRKYIPSLPFVLKLFRAMRDQCGKVARKFAPRARYKASDLFAKLLEAPETHIIKIGEMRKGLQCK